MATAEDLAFTDELEKEALPIIEPYYRKNFDIFSAEIPGDLIIVLDGEYPVGMGRYSFHPDGTMWLETLRVRPAYQHQGIGTGIYEFYEKIAREHDVKYIRLYTETFNEKSLGLSRKMGYHVLQDYDYFSLQSPLNDFGSESDESTVRPRPHGFGLEQGANKSRPHPHGFLPESDANKVLTFMKANPWTDFLCLNNVFYEANEANIRWMVEQGMAYFNQERESLLLQGARHNKDKAAYLIYMAGDFAAAVEATLEFNPGKTVSAALSKNNSQLRPYFQAFDHRYDLIVSEKKL